MSDLQQFVKKLKSHKDKQKTIEELIKIEKFLKTSINELYEEKTTFHSKAYYYNNCKEKHETIFVKPEEYIEQLENIKSTVEIEFHKQQIIESIKFLESHFNKKIEFLNEKYNNVKKSLNYLDKEIQNFHIDEHPYKTLYTISKKSFEFSDHYINIINSYDFIYEDDKRYYVLNHVSIMDDFEGDGKIKCRLNKQYFLNSRFLERLYPKLLNLIEDY